MRDVFSYQILRLSDEFYRDYPNPPYAEILKKPKRGYTCLLLQSNNGYYICIPYRSHISHRYAFHFHHTKRSKKQRSGLDYTKIVIITDREYLGTENIVIDQDEFVETRKNIRYIARNADKYVEDYIKHMRGKDLLDVREFRRKYGCSTLVYFHKELNIIKCLAKEE